MLHIIHLRTHYTNGSGIWIIRRPMELYTAPSFTTRNSSVTMRNDSKQNAAHLRTKWLGRGIGTPASNARSEVQISAPRPDFLTSVVVLFSSYRKTTRRCLRLGYKLFLPHPFHFIIHYNATIQRHTDRQTQSVLKQAILGQPHISCQYCARRTVVESFTFYNFCVNIFYSQKSIPTCCTVSLKMS